MLGAIMGIGAGIAKGIMGNQAKKDQCEENKQLMEYQAKLNKTSVLFHRIGKGFMELYQL